MINRAGSSEQHAMDTRFYEAAVSQDLARLSRLAKDHPGVVDAVTPVGDNALHIALRRWFVEELSGSSLINNLPQSLLSLLTQANKKGETPLHAALKSGNKITFVRCVEALLQPDWMDLEKGQLPSSSPDADHQAGEEPRKSLLYLAAEAGSLEAVKVLLRSPWPWAHDSRGPKDSTALHSAIIHGHTAVWEELVSRMPGLIWCKDANGDTPLHLAVCMENDELVKLLVKKDAGVAFALNKDGHSPVHVAAALGFRNCFKSIHELCPEACLRTTESGSNSLHVAVRNGRKEIVEYILSEFDKVMINEQDMHGETPLHVAYRWHLPWMIRTLSRHKLVNGNVLNDDGLNCSQAIQLLDRKEKLYMNNTFGMFLADVKSLSGASRLQGLHNDIEFYESDILSSMIPERVKVLANSSSVVATLIVGVAIGAAFSVTTIYNNGARHDTTTRVLFKIFHLSNAMSAILAILAAFSLIMAGGLSDLFYLRIKVRRSMLAVQTALRLLLVAFGLGLFVVTEVRWLAVVLVVMSCLAPILIPVWSYFQEDRSLMDTFGGPLKLIIPLIVLVHIYRFGKAARACLQNTAFLFCCPCVLGWNFCVKNNEDACDADEYDF